MKMTSLTCSFERFDWLFSISEYVENCTGKAKQESKIALWASVTHIGLIFGFLSFFFYDIALISDIAALT